MTGSVKLKVQPVSHKAAAAAPGKKVTAIAKKSGRDTARKPGEPVATKAAAPGPARRKAEAVKPAKPLKAKSAKPLVPLKPVKPLKPGKSDAAEPATTETVVAPAMKPATTRAGAPKAKLNKRSAETIAKILETTGEIILQSGADRISILDVCEQAGISRGTFYRYFSSQDDLLDAFSRHTRDQFHATLLAVTAGIDDPDARFQAVLGFVDNYLEKSRAGRLLLVAPEYALRWFQRIFNDSVHRFQDILSISFDAWEERRGIALDRELICELMVRFILSEVLVPSGAERRNLMRRIERFVVMLLSGRVARR